MSAAAIGRDDTLELRLKALRLPSFHEQYLELANAPELKAGTTCDILPNWSPRKPTTAQIDA